MVTKTRTASRAENYIISTHSLKNLIPSSLCLLESSFRPVTVVTISRGTKLILTALIVSSTLEWEYTGTDIVQLQACAGKPVGVVHLWPTEWMHYALCSPTWPTVWIHYALPTDSQKQTKRLIRFRRFQHSHTHTFWTLRKNVKATCS